MKQIVCQTKRVNCAKRVCAASAWCATLSMALPAQVLTTLHSFDGPTTPVYAALIQATDGNLYGTSWDGGPHNHGTVFKLTPGGVFTTLHAFCPQLPCTDG